MKQRFVTCFKKQIILSWRQRRATKRRVSQRRARGLLTGLFICLIVETSSGQAGSVTSQRWRFSEQHMATQVTITLFADDEADALDSARRAFARITELEAQLSDYRPTSEVRQLCARGSAAYDRRVPVSDPLWTVLVAAQEVAAQSEGAFDVTAGALTRIFRRAARKNQLPTEQHLAKARESTGWRKLELSPEERSVFLATSSMRIDLGGIAKGFIADEALKVIVENGHTSAMIDAGGDLALGGPPPGESGWKIAVAPQTATITTRRLAYCGVATSGDAYKATTVEGQRLSHIVDPRDGTTTGQRWPATVIATNCMLADAWASAAVLLGPPVLQTADQDAAFETLILDLRQEPPQPLRSSAFDRISGFPPSCSAANP